MADKKFRDRRKRADAVCVKRDGYYVGRLENQKMKDGNRSIPGSRAKARMTDKCCNMCGDGLNTWDVRLSKTLAYKIPVCEECIAKEYDMDVGALRERMEAYFGMRPCQGL